MENKNRHVDFNIKEATGRFVKYCVTLSIALYFLLFYSAVTISDTHACYTKLNIKVLLIIIRAFI